jgi:hypothetical protein
LFSFANRSGTMRFLIGSANATGAGEILGYPHRALEAPLGCHVAWNLRAPPQTRGVEAVHAALIGEMTRQRAQIAFGGDEFFHLEDI